jgi:hypothetical protein
MKRLIKRAMRAVYRRTEFIRRPIRAELEAGLKACVAGSFEEVRVVMDDLVSEVYRLQNQVADLRAEVTTLRGRDVA